MEFKNRDSAQDLRIARRGPMVQYKAMPEQYSEFNPLDRERLLMAKDKAFKGKLDNNIEFTRSEALRQDIQEEREKRGLYGNPLLAGAVVTQFFATVAANDTASYGCTILALGLLIFGVNIYVKHTRRINRLRAELAAAESKTQP